MHVIREDLINKNLLFVYIVNKAEQQKTLNLDIAGRSINSVIQAWELVSTGPEDTNPIYRQKQIHDKNKLTVEPVSITLVELKLK